MQIDYLADHLEAVPRLADWHHGEWKESTLEWTAAELRTHTLRGHIPTTFVAIDEGRIIGSASLLTADLPGWDHLTPWVASVYVPPDCRRRGIGRALIARAVEEARKLGVPEVFLYTASKQDYYARLGWQTVEHAQYKGKRIVIMRQTLGLAAATSTICPEERSFLEKLDVLVARSAVHDYLAQVVERVTRRLAQQTTSTMAWEPLPLEIYGSALPPSIRSSWIFVLRSGATTGAERHPNSHQRMMSLRGAGDIQTCGEGCWQSNPLVSNEDAELLRRWASIPPNVWHQAVVPSQDWAVVSFHTAATEELIEERPNAGNASVTHQRHYLEP
jgi:predicted N-acetyltransferase YhbS